MLYALESENCSYIIIHKSRGPGLSAAGAAGGFVAETGEFPPRAGWHGRTRTRLVACAALPPQSEVGRPSARAGGRRTIALGRPFFFTSLEVSELEGACCRLSSKAAAAWVMSDSFFLGGAPSSEVCKYNVLIYSSTDLRFFSAAGGLVLFRAFFQAGGKGGLGKKKKRMTI